MHDKTPPDDVVRFFASAAVDIDTITGPLRGMEARVAEATRLRAIAYIPNGKAEEKAEK